MKEQLELLKTTRNNALTAIAGLSTEQLNKIPEKFNNNLVWHLGHMVVTQQVLIYGKSGLPVNIDKDWVTKYKKGTKPEGFIEASEIEQIKIKLTETAELLDADFSKNLFKDFQNYPTSYGFTLTSAAGAVAFNNVHEAMHYGNILSMRKLV